MRQNAAKALQQQVGAALAAPPVPHIFEAGRFEVYIAAGLCGLDGSCNRVCQISRNWSLSAATSPAMSLFNLTTAHLHSAADVLVSQRAVLCRSGPCHVRTLILDISGDGQFGTRTEGDVHALRDFWSKNKDM